MATTLSVFQRTHQGITANNALLKSSLSLNKRLPVKQLPSGFINKMRKPLPTLPKQPLPALPKDSAGLRNKLNALKAGVLVPNQPVPDVKKVAQLEQQVVQLQNRELQAQKTTNPVLKAQLINQVEKEAKTLHSSIWDCANCKQAQTAPAMYVSYVKPGVAATTTAAPGTQEAPATTASFTASQPAAVKTASSGKVFAFLGALALGGFLLFGGNKEDKKEGLNGAPKSSKTLKASI